MKYEEALQRWGAQKLEAIYKKPIKLDTVTVQLNFNKGYTCCGSDNRPDCYCSLAESPSAEILVTGIEAEPKGKRAKLYPWRSYRIESYDFSFTEFLGEVVAAGDGTLQL